MASVSSDAYFDRVTDPLFEFLTREQTQRIADFTVDPSLDARIAELARKCNEGGMTAEEQAEYEGYVRGNKFASIWRAKARRLLNEGRG